MPRTIVVGCRLPNGFWMQRQERRKMWQAGPQGMVEVEVSVPVGDPVKIRGTAVAFGQPPLADANGYVLTTVDAELWDSWIKEYRLWEPVVGRHVVAHATDSAGAMREAAGGRTGLEAMDPSAPGPGLTPINMSVG